MRDIVMSLVWAVALAFPLLILALLASAALGLPAW